MPGWLDGLGVLSAAALLVMREVQAGRPAGDGPPRDEDGRMPFMKWVG